MSYSDKSLIYLSLPVTSESKVSLASKMLIPLLTLAVATNGSAQALQGNALVHALQRGGYVLVMRHASSPLQAPAKHAADPANSRDERQLDEKGRLTATAMGNALRQIKIPVGEVLSSPTYRALETVRYAQLGTPRTYAQLGDNGKSMQSDTDAQAHWLQNKVTQFPFGTNTIIVTHNPNLIAAFPQFAKEVEDGESLVFGPDSKGGATLVARIRIEDWKSMRH
jgi:phosphohistidine phosphatase SixA